MCGNPYKLDDKVSGDWEVEKPSITIIDSDIPELMEKLKWREEQPYLECLTLNEILGQAKEIKESLGLGNRTPFIKALYESGLWGVIIIVGNYPEKTPKWYVHGITRGYA